jgi:murein DD-endopeptidase MepM/ murein hydrolase activator NlpD
MKLKDIDLDYISQKRQGSILYKNLNRSDSDSEEMILNKPTLNFSSTSYTAKQDLNLNYLDKIKVGNSILKITDPYGIRKNIPGREGEHSTGVDFTTNTKKVVSLTDGVIESVKLQGSGEKTDTKSDKSAGWYVVVKNNDGTKSQYMHLNPFTEEDIKSLVGKKVTRGEEFWGYDIGSGSMTAPHVKYRVFTGANALNSHINPSKYILGKYE